MLLIHLFVCFARVCFCPFSLLSGVEGLLRFVIVAWTCILDFSINFFTEKLKQMTDKCITSKVINEKPSPLRSHTRSKD